MNDLVDFARSIIRMSDDLARARGQITTLQGRIEEQRQASLSGAQERERLLRRLMAVTDLHWERERVSCGDGCCHEGLGTCRYCNEPWPCKTYKLADGDGE